MEARQKRLWILEDDEGCRFVYDQILGGTYDVLMFADLESFRTALNSPPAGPPDLVIADIRLPGASFLNYLRSEDAKNISHLPFLVVSSVDDMDALHECFDAGAIDYITKPFGKAELSVKVEKILTRPPAPRPPKEGIVVDPTTLTIFRGERRSEVLTPREFQIVAILDKSANHILSRQDIITRVWESVQVSAKTLDVHLSNLRKKLSAIDVEIAHRPPNLYQLVVSKRP